MTRDRAICKKVKRIYMQAHPHIPWRSSRSLFREKHFSFIQEDTRGRATVYYLSRVGFSSFECHRKLHPSRQSIRWDEFPCFGFLLLNVVPGKKLERKFWLIVNGTFWTLWFVFIRMKMPKIYIEVDDDDSNGQRQWSYIHLFVEIKRSTDIKILSRQSISRHKAFVTWWR